MMNVVALAGSIMSGLDDLFTSDEERLDAHHRIQTLISEAANRQAEINLQEAKHKSIFVAGWRPALGWLCVSCLAYGIILRDICLIFLVAAGVDITLPVLEMEKIYTMLGGLLGFGAFRSFEKAKGVAS